MGKDVKLYLKKQFWRIFSMITADLLAPVKDAVLQAVPSILPVGAAVLGASLAVRFAVSTLKKFFLIKSTRKGAF
jgi:hypothetical protein